VFAIVITLMAIEIHLPEIPGKMDEHELLHQLGHLAPMVIAYMVSFIFIGLIWYQHLQLFALLRDYDKGLVVRNLLLLFFIGLFPFSASVITRVKGNILAVFIYMGVIMLCVLAQFLLYHYIIVRRPGLRRNTDIRAHMDELHNRKWALICFAGAAVLIAITYFAISDPELKALSTLWMVAFPIAYRRLMRRKH
jgi:uncharacterized membrane protein